MKQSSIKMPKVGPDGFTRGGTVWIQSGFDPTDISTYDGIAIDPDGGTLGTDYIGISVWENAEMRVLINNAGILIKGGNSAWIPDDYDVDAPEGLVINNNGGADDGITIWNTPIATPIKRLQINASGMMVYGGYAAFVPEDYDPDNIHGVLIEAANGITIWDSDTLKIHLGFYTDPTGTTYQGLAGYAVYDPVTPANNVLNFFIDSGGDFSFGSDPDSQFSFIASTATMRIGPAVTILATEGDATAGEVADKTTLGLTSGGLITKPVTTENITYGYHGTWDSGHAYIINDTVLSSGTYYVAILDGTNHTPASSPTYWTALASDPNPASGMIVDSEGLRWYAGSALKFNLDNAGNGVFSGNLEGATVTAGTNLTLEGDVEGSATITVGEAGTIKVYVPDTMGDLPQLKFDALADGGSDLFAGYIYSFHDVFFEFTNQFRVKGGNIFMETADKGIDFSAQTSPASGVASELFNHYERGDFTPGLTFGGNAVDMTFSSRGGKYEKAGKWVRVTGAIALSAKGSSTGAAVITDLDFTCLDATGAYSAVNLRLVNITFANQFQGYVAKNTKTIILEEITEAGSMTALTDADFANNSQIIFSAVYEAA